MTAEGIKPLLCGAVFDRMTPDRKMYIDGEDIYVPTDQGLFVVRDKRWRLLTAKDDIFTLVREGQRLYALAADGIYTLKDDTLTLCTAYHFEAPDYGLFVRRNPRGGLFIADAHTLYRYDGQRVNTLASGFNLVKSLLVDRWGRLWMATYQGVYLFFHNDFTLHRLSDPDKPARSVAEEVSYIRNYLALEKLRFEERLQYSITMADNVNKQTLMPTMALYTYCQNAVKHGIGNKAKGGRVEVNVSQRDGMLAVAVKDDDVGRAQAAHLNTNSTKQGLRILHEQIALFNQSNEQPIRETVTDLFDEQGRPASS